MKAIALKRVESRPSTKYKRPVRKNEIMLKKMILFAIFLLMQNEKVIWKIRRGLQIPYTRLLFIKFEKKLS